LVSALFHSLFKATNLPRIDGLTQAAKMSNLDDFFAKKDKKKGKKKTFATSNTETLAKNLEKQEMKEAKADEKTQAPLATSEANKAQAALAAKGDSIEDEWKDYEEDKKDYSNLKIDALKVESDPEEGGDEDEHEINEDGEKVPKKGGGPWNKGKAEASSSGAADSGEQDIEELRRREKERAKAELESSIGAPKGSVVGGSYVPPHMRGGGERQQVVAPMRGGPRRTKHVPDMNSEINFPSLGGEAVGNNNKQERDFEEVRGSGSSQHYTSRSNGAPSLALGNKFAALRS